MTSNFDDPTAPSMFCYKVDDYNDGDDDDNDDDTDNEHCVCHYCY